MDPKFPSQQEYLKVFNRRFFEKVTGHTSEVLEILRRSKETTEIYKILSYISERNAGVYVEDRIKYLALWLLDNDGQIVTVMDVSTNDNATSTCVSRETYDELKSKAVDTEITYFDLREELGEAPF